MTTEPKLRSYEDQKKAIEKFLKELAKLEKKHRVYVDGWYITGRYREIINTKQDWTLDQDQQDRG